MPRVRSVSERTEFITLTQAQRILTALKGHPLYELVYITLYYGLRRSEVLGLKWSAVDFAEDALHINHTVVKNLTIVAKDRTKTDSSRRTFPLFPEVKEMLLRMKAESNGRSEYIFTWDDGRLYRPDYVTSNYLIMSGEVQDISLDKIWKNCSQGFLGKVILGWSRG